MRFSELAGKELVDVREGVRLGELGDADLVFEADTGYVRSVVVAPRRSWWQRHRELVIPWRGIRKIGIDLIMVDLGTVAGAAMEDREPYGGDYGTPYDYGPEPEDDHEPAIDEQDYPGGDANGTWRTSGRDGGRSARGPRRGLFFFRRR